MLLLLGEQVVVGVLVLGQGKHPALSWAEQRGNFLGSLLAWVLLGAVGGDLGLVLVKADDNGVKAVEVLVGLGDVLDG